MAGYNRSRGLIYTLERWQSACVTGICGRASLSGSRREKDGMIRTEKTGSAVHDEDDLVEFSGPLPGIDPAQEFALHQVELH